MAKKPEGNHAADAADASTGAQWAKFEAIRERWLNDLSITFKAIGNDSNKLTEVLRDYAKVGLREICAALLDYDLVSAIVSVVSEAYLEYLQKEFREANHDEIKRPAVWDAEARGFRYDLPESTASATRMPFLYPGNSFSDAQALIDARNGSKIDSFRDTAWDIGFALRSKVIPSSNGLVAVLGQPNAQICWREYIRLEDEDNKARLLLPNLDPGVRARILTSNPLQAEMPPSFMEAVTGLHSQFRTLFRGLAIGLLAGFGVHPVTRETKQLEPRIWNRANIALDLRTGDLINTRTGEVEWYDVCLSAKRPENQEQNFVSEEIDDKNKGGRDVKYDWLRALDKLLHSKQFSLKKYYKSAAEFEADLADFAKTAKGDTPDDSSARRWFRAQFPNLHAQLTKGPDSAPGVSDKPD